MTGYFYFLKVRSPVPLIFSFSVFSSIVPYGPLEVHARLLNREMYWWPLSFSLPLIHLLHWSGVIHLSGVSYRGTIKFTY